MIDEKAAKALSAAVFRMAVDDLRAAHKKLLKLEKLEEKGELREYVKKKMKQSPSDITFSQDDLSAVTFFKKNSKERALYGGMIELDDTIPREISQKVRYFESNHDKISKKIMYHKAVITRKKNDALL